MHKSILEQMSENFNAMSDEDKARMRRVVRGEDNNDLLRREDVRKAIRSLRTNPVPSREYQKALSDVTRLVTDLKAVKEATPDATSILKG